MSAKEMWKNLGCEVIENLKGIYILNSNKTVLMIFTDNYYSTENTFNITKEIHKAIMKQLKELGWESDK